MDAIKIASLRLENVKRVRAVSIVPTENGLTVIGGRNGQGKTSILDAIAWALGGDRYKPTTAQRAGSVLPPDLEVRLSNGLIVQRKGKAGTLTVTDPQGKRYGQTLLNEFVSTFAIDLPKFLDATDKDKAETLLRVIGVGDELQALEAREKDTYNRRRAIGQIADQKEKFAREMPAFDGVPEAPVSAGELIAQQQEILARNGENQRKRERLNAITLRKHGLFDDLRRMDEQMEEMKKRRDELMAQYNETVQDEAVALKTVSELQDESTAELEANIAMVDEINRKVRANLDKERAEDDARQMRGEYDTLSAELEAIRGEKKALLDGASLPLPELTVEDGRLLYRGYTWDGMSASEQMIVGAAIARALNPACGFILVDKLEQLDMETLKAFGAWAESERLQIIATRVTTGDESCTIVIEDGEAVKADVEEPQEIFSPRGWTEGEF